MVHEKTFVTVATTARCDRTVTIHLQNLDVTQAHETKVVTTNMRTEPNGTNREKARTILGRQFVVDQPDAVIERHSPRFASQKS
jgi:hypothetical protein